VAISEEARAAITASLQRFQVGESGEGKYLKKYAAQTGDAEYAQAIDLFIAEENYHAQLLAQVLKALQVPLLQGHWSDTAFIILRRFGGLHAELMILLVAELIAKRYYRVLQNATQDENIRLMCAQILRDENAHVAFHCDTLSRAFAHHSSARRAWTLLSWKSFYRFVCFIVACDHRKVLFAANVSIIDWMRSTNDVFDQAAHSIFDVAKTEVKRSVTPCLREGKKYF
jgi:rubrerythrin